MTDAYTQLVSVDVANTPPTALFTVDPTSGTTLTIFNFDASSSTDNEDATSALEVRWDWENDGTYYTNYSTTKTATNQYVTEGTKTIKLEVKDSGGLKTTTTKQVTVSFSSGYTGTMTDIDGNLYNTIQISDQLWMAENLKVTHYRNGDEIPNITDHTQWSNLYTGAYCNLGNDESNVATYGRLYNWYTINDSRGLAPTGWHIPSDEEWKELEMYLGMSQTEADDEDSYRGTNEGSKLKSRNGWPSGFNGTNESGFSALPGGTRSYQGEFGVMGYYASIWTSTESDSTFAWSWERSLGYADKGVGRFSYYKYGGMSVRCIED